MLFEEKDDDDVDVDENGGDQYTEYQMNTAIKPLHQSNPGHRIRNLLRF